MTEKDKTNALTKLCSPTPNAKDGVDDEGGMLTAILDTLEGERTKLKASVEWVRGGAKIIGQFCKRARCALHVLQQKQASVREAASPHARATTSNLILFESIALDVAPSRPPLSALVSPCVTDEH